MLTFIVMNFRDNDSGKISLTYKMDVFYCCILKAVDQVNTCICKTIVFVIHSLVLGKNVSQFLQNKILRHLLSFYTE